jgi:excisionase family DNA binding protein
MTLFNLFQYSEGMQEAREEVMTVAEREEVMTVAEVAKLLRVNRKTVEKLIYAGKLHAVKIGRVWRIPRTAVVRFLEGGEHREP